MEKMCALFALSGPIGPAGLLAYLIALKLRAPSIFDGLLRNDHDSHRAAAEWINGRAGGSGFDSDSTEVTYLAAVRELHFGLIAPDKTERKHLTGGIANWILGQIGLSAERAFAIVLKRIDLTLEA
jgi:hypothetical protein